MNRTILKKNLIKNKTFKFSSKALATLAGKRPELRKLSMMHVTLPAVKLLAEFCFLNCPRGSTVASLVRSPAAVFLIVTFIIHWD